MAGHFLIYATLAPFKQTTVKIKASHWKTSFLSLCLSKHRLTRSQDLTWPTSNVKGCWCLAEHKWHVRFLLDTMELWTFSRSCSWISHWLLLLQVLSDGTDHKALNFQYLLCKTDINKASNKLQTEVLQKVMVSQISWFGCWEFSQTLLISLKLWKALWAVISTASKHEISRGKKKISPYCWKKTFLKLNNFPLVQNRLQW